MCHIVLNFIQHVHFKLSDKWFGFLYKFQIHTEFIIFYDAFAHKTIVEL